MSQEKVPKYMRQAEKKQNPIQRKSSTSAIYSIMPILITHKEGWYSL